MDDEAWYDWHNAKDYKKRGIESGMDPFNLPDIMNLDLFINNQYTKELGVQEDDIEEAIADLIRVSQGIIRRQG